MVLCAAKNERAAKGKVDDVPVWSEMKNTTGGNSGAPFVGLNVIACV